MPPHTVYVGRPTDWGNPFTVRLWPNGMDAQAWTVLRDGRTFGKAFYARKEDAVKEALHEFKRLVETTPSWYENLWNLKGKDLVCWCPLNQPCHADILLELANA